MNRTEDPVVSVLLPVFNGEKYVKAAVDSILQQTFTDFELIIIDDGSTDRTLTLLQAFNDSRIRLVPNSTNRGIVNALNQALGLARGSYLARMDADDIAWPRRLEKQVVRMEANPQIGVCGSWMHILGEKPSSLWRSPRFHEEIAAELVFSSPLFHPTVMLRRSVLQQHQLTYSGEYPGAEDFELWNRLAKVTRLENLDEPLLDYRFHPGQSGQRSSAVQLASANRLRRLQLRGLGIDADERELSLHSAVARFQFESSWGFLDRMEGWLERLATAVRRQHYLDPVVFERNLGARWFFACRHLEPHGVRAWRRFRQARFSRTGQLPFLSRSAFFGRCLGRSMKRREP